MDEKDYIEDIDEYCMYVHVSSTLHIQLISDYEKFTNQQSNHTYIKNSTQQLLIHQQNI